MIPDTVKAFAGLFLIVTLGIALGFSRWELSSLNKDYIKLKVEIDVQDTLAKTQQVKFKETQDDLTKKIDSNGQLIAANRLLRAANKVSPSPTPDSPECTYEAATPVDTETVEFGFRDQAVDVANQLELLKLFVTENKLPVGL